MFNDETAYGSYGEFHDAGESEWTEAEWADYDAQISAEIDAHDAQLEAEMEMWDAAYPG